MRFFKKHETSQEDSLSETSELRQAVLQAKLPDTVQDFALKEVDRMTKMGSSSAEYTISMNHLEYICSLPWNRMTDDNLDIQRAQTILDKEHYGLTEIKDRILEHLAVRVLKNARKYRILVVDDEQLTCKNLEHILKKEGYEVITAYSGEKAIEALQQYHFDIILADLKMEQIDGIQVLEKAKEINPATEVIIFTGYATVPAAVSAIQKGSSQFLSKPLQLEEVRRVTSEAVIKKKAKLEPQGPILCFVGPPGTGKTSLGLAIARSLERSFIRMSLAGVKDEAQLRGHRRSYVGALPGRIIQEIRRAETKNPVFMLDEIDKLGQEFKGDPASALLEILDPEQNKYFMDHYLDVPFDLSKVMFIATANTTEPVPEPLLDRLEVLYLPGYTEEEKGQIAFNHLIPKEISHASLQEYPISFTPEAVQKIIREYTREAGLRNLQREIASLCRKTARKLLQKQDDQNHFLTISPFIVEELLGPRKYSFEVAAAKDRIGVATGLAWTPYGGEIMFVEATKMAGSNNLLLTGSLGDILKESAHAALSYIRSHAHEFNVQDGFFQEHDLHIHVPSGAISKDGPSAGLTIAIALLSLITDRPCKREVALSGELTLSGRILPVSGIREKLLAARNSGVSTVVFSSKNNIDIKNIPESITQKLKIVLIQELTEIVDFVLLPAMATSCGSSHNSPTTERQTQ
jgi:ATP-dependent Lon protease